MRPRTDCTACCWHELRYDFIDGKFEIDCICWSEAEEYGWHEACCRYVYAGWVDAKKCPWFRG